MAVNVWIIHESQYCQYQRLPSYILAKVMATLASRFRQLLEVSFIHNSLEAVVVLGTWCVQDPAEKISNGS